MFKELITKIQNTLSGVKAIKSVYPRPVKEGEKIPSYPAVIFYPSNFENRFETTADNFKEYRFSLFVICDTSGDVPLSKIWSEILPNAVDQVIAAFDENWSVSVSGANRSWQLIDSGNWSMYPTDKPLEVIAELTLRIRLLTSN